MSRWTSNFESHGFNDAWKQTQDALGAIEADDPIVIAEAEEIARLRKVAAYVDKALLGVDPELLPFNFWDGLRDQFAACAQSLKAFITDKNPQHLRSANQNIDSALSQLRPHLLAKGRLGPALQSAAKAYATAIESASKDLSDRALAAVAATGSSQEKAAALLQGVDGKVQAINEKYDELLVDTDERDSTITELKAEVDEIKAFHKRLTVGSGDSPSIREEVSVAREVVQKGKEAIEKLRTSAAATIEGLTNFETRIFGPVRDDGQREGGLKSELDSRMSELGDVELQQKRRYGALNEKIESLLPGATSAGLASAYNQMKASFDTPIKNANRVFYFSIAALVVLSLLVNVVSIGFWSIEFVHLTDWASVGRMLAHKLPFYVPLVWLAYFSSKRRSEFQRLQQEYAHKEALAKSYDSYRRQIDELGSEGDELRRDLLAKSVDAIAFNASSSLDGKHGDKIPLQEAIEQAVTVAMGIAKGEKSS